MIHYPFYLKKVEGSKTVQVGNYSIPPGVDVFPGLRYIMHDPKHWDMPWEFRPERFLDPETGNAVTNNPHFVPFQVSNKTFIGISFSKNSQIYHFFRLDHVLALPRALSWTSHSPCSPELPGTSRLSMVEG